MADILRDHLPCLRKSFTRTEGEKYIITEFNYVPS